ncbi:hypothetical protein BT69DRAFT_331994 [Atractiella rhizophila]|nr:hypothetical protein BT69DRAFT_331994 [Atractiella rhizophila]
MKVSCPTQLTNALCENTQMISILLQSTLHVSSTRAALEAMVHNDLQLFNPSYVPPPLPSSSTTSTDSARPSAAVLTQEEERELRHRLDAIGHRVGWAMAERLTRDRPPFALQAQPAPNMPNASSSHGPSSTSKEPPKPEPLEIIKFVCKDLWITLYGKQIDNLRTNHRGVWVLQDNRFAGGGLGRAGGWDMDMGWERRGGRGAGDGSGGSGSSSADDGASRSDIYHHGQY